MKATHIVINAKDKTVGYVIDDKYETYKTVLENIEYVDNLVPDDRGILTCKEGSLPKLTKRELSSNIYEYLCKQNTTKEKAEGCCNSSNLFEKRWLNADFGHLIMIKNDKKYNKA